MNRAGVIPYLLTATAFLVLCSADQFTTISRADRFLSLFSLVRFKNSQCNGNNGLMGTCYTTKSCIKNGGSAQGVCAGGFGSCCVTQIGCGSLTSNNCTYIESPNYPGFVNEALNCVHTIVLNSDVCQVRMDVTEVRLTAPNTKGVCLNDVLTFSQDTKWSQVCGLTEDTHFYLDVDTATSRTLDFTFNLDASNFDRRWRIKVSQICCDQFSIAPTGCGQYFTTATGTINAWNAQGNPDYYLSGQSYAICVRQELDSCSYTYQDLNPSGLLFIPVCSDTLEWPGTHIMGTTGIQDDTCQPGGSAGISIPVFDINIEQQGSHYFYFVTTDSSNEHVFGGSSVGNVRISFTQNAC